METTVKRMEKGVHNIILKIKQKTMRELSNNRPNIINGKNLWKDTERNGKKAANGTVSEGKLNFTADRSCIDLIYTLKRKAYDSVLTKLWKAMKKLEIQNRSYKNHYKETILIGNFNRQQRKLKLHDEENTRRVH